MFELIFGNSITRKVEHKRRLEGELAVLKKQQKVKSDNVIKTYDIRKTTLIDNTNAQIGSLQAQIAALKTNKETQCKLIDEERKVALDKVIMEFDQKIINKRNKVKKLGHLIEAEKQSIEDVMDPESPYAPIKDKQVLLEKAKK